MKDKLLRKFYTVRLYIFARKQLDIGKRRIQDSKSGGELCSKSVAMHVIVKKHSNDLF